MSRATYRVRVEKDVPTPMCDGTVLRADVYRPQGGSAFPVLLLRTPYGKGIPPRLDQSEALAACGYIVVIQDVRGRYASDGEFDPHQSETGGESDVADGHDTVEWAAGLPGASGAVGTFGVSYMAQTQWTLALARPPHLRAMFAGGHGPDSRLTWPGIFTRDRQLQWLLCTMVPDMRRRLGLPGPQTVEEAQALWDRVDRGKWLWFTPMQDFPPEVLGGFQKHWRRWLTTLNTNFLRFDGRFAEVDVPIYHFTGWYDRIWGAIEYFRGMASQGRTEATRRSQKLIVGPWSHGLEFPRRVGILDFGPEAELSSIDLLCRWFDYWLKGIDTGVMQEPPVRLFVMGDNRWRYEKQWPPKGVVYTNYYCHSGGQAKTPHGDGRLTPLPPAEEPPDRFIYDPRDPVMSLHPPSAQPAPVDLRPHDYRRDILVYQTPPLEHDVEVVGPLTFRLHAASSALDTDWTVRVVDVYPDGLPVNVSYGILRGRYRDSWETPTPLEPARPYEYVISMVPTGISFKAGHRIRVDVSSSDFPNYDRNHNTGLNYWEDSTFVTARQTVFHDAARPSHIVLPIAPR